jgi:hypothetical protein
LLKLKGETFGKTKMCVEAKKEVFSIHSETHLGIEKKY